MKQLKSVIHSAMVECQFDLSDTETFEVSPFPIPSLFHNVFYHVYVRAPEIHEDSGVLITGCAGEKQIDLPIVVNPVPPAIRLDKFFAYLNIRDLEKRISIAPEPEIPVLKGRVVRLSMKTALVSQFTALTATLEGVPERHVDQCAGARRLVQTQIPVQQFKQEATHRQQRGQCARARRVGYEFFRSSSDSIETTDNASMLFR
jgi:hypothetical protein